MPPFQQKRSADAGHNDWPDPKGVEAYQTGPREQESRASDQKERARDNAVKGMVLDPIGSAANSHREKARSPRRPKRGQIDPDKA